jgi:uncharacterized protein YqjF (DUF2071 family)
VSALDFLDLPARQAGVAEIIDHRPWPLPVEPWSSAQTWLDLAFLHWRVDERELRRLLPESVELETFDGAAWIGIVPFVVTGVRLRGLPPIPRISTFPELNVRTYVSHDNRPGIWFFALDAASTWFTEAGKLLYRLPYNRAQMRSERFGEQVQFESARTGAMFSGRYRGNADPFRAEPGSLDAFLTERYCLYTEDGGRLYRAEIHHPPWDLQRGSAFVALNTASPLPLLDAQPHVLIAARQDVVLWPLREI